MIPNLLPHLLPITSTLCFLEATPERAAESFCDWQDSIFAKHGTKTARTELVLPLEDTLRSLLPLTTVRSRRTLFVATKSPWTLVSDNGAQGTDTAPTSQLALRLQTRAVRATFVPSTTPSMTGRKPFTRGRATIFELYGPAPSPLLNIARSVAAAHDDDRWVFETSGDPLPFENLERFRAKRLRDRFGPEALDYYLQSLGIDGFNPAFYEERAILCENTHPRPAAMEDFTLEEARAR